MFHEVLCLVLTNTWLCSTAKIFHTCHGFGHPQFNWSSIGNVLDCWSRTVHCDMNSWKSGKLRKFRKVKENQWIICQFYFDMSVFSNCKSDEYTMVLIANSGLKKSRNSVTVQRIALPPMLWPSLLLP